MDNLSTPHCEGCPDPYYCFYEGYCIHDEADEPIKGNHDHGTQQQAPSAPSVGEASAQRIIDNLHGILHKIAWSK